MKTNKTLICLISISIVLTSGIYGFTQGAGGGGMLSGKKDMTLLDTNTPASAQIEPLGQFDGHCDLGSPAITGSASYDAAQQTYTVNAGGINFWGNNDQGHFLWKKLSGDFILRAKLDPMEAGAVEHRKLGWMVRSSLAANAAFADGVVENGEGQGLASLQYRRVDGGQCAMKALPIKIAYVVQLERHGTNLIYSASLDGESFASANCTSVSLPDDVYAGLCICAHGPGLKGSVVFRDVQITRPIK